MTDKPVDFEQAASMGISHEAYDEIVGIVGRIPTMSELATLLAMWESNGRQQSLYGWLKGQHHQVVRNDYLYSGADSYRTIQEPRIKECLSIAHELCKANPIHPRPHALSTGTLLYMIGNVNTDFTDSEYARRCLHIFTDSETSSIDSTDESYITLITNALHTAGIVLCPTPVANGGIFCSLLKLTAPLGFDILCPREVRLDAFLFGEEYGRQLVAIAETNEDSFLLKLAEARLNCCFLGRTTKGRIVVDGYDFGSATEYLAQ
ncbi:MAG: hypothetical protein IJU19_03875 [Bacteroidales bacterium]|nr:hypothetical protein [Bacteroidales bacterium]